MLSFVKSYLYVLLLLGSIPLQASSPGGLKFHGSEQPIDKRTSYNALGDQTAVFQDYFGVEFSLSSIPTTAFGYIVRIKSKQSNRICHLFYDGQGDNLACKFNERRQEQPDPLPT